MMRSRSHVLLLALCAAAFTLVPLAHPTAQQRVSGAPAASTAAPQAAPSARPAAAPARGRGAAPMAPAAVPDASAYAKALGSLKFREIGPAAMGGRIDDFAVVESNPATVYVGTASGGLWKTTNAGTTWTPLFDKEAVSTIGDVTLAPSDPSIVWVGTGEPNNRQSSSWGNGVYKSTDAGGTWTNMGLRDTHHIGRIVIHPTNPNVVYVAAVGRLWGPNQERGLYKTTDGGATWKQVLFVSRDTGVIDVLSASAHGVRLRGQRPRGWHPQDDRRRRDVEEAREGAAVGPRRRAGSARPG
jgi:photosystem II stability/assembly factor-like uncharacterized protein